MNGGIVKNKILLIDDDPFILDMYAVKLKEAGFEIFIARDGKDGLAKIAEIKPDVILLDLVMPILNGFDVLAEIKKNKPEPKPKIIVLTNLGEKEDLKRSFEFGADDYMIKAHFIPTEVAAKVKTVLSDSKK